VGGIDIATDVAANTLKTGITTGQANEITANTSKVVITTGQSDAIIANTNKETNATHSGDVTGSEALTIAADAVDIAMLSATGTADNTTYLRGDNTWGTPSGSGTGDVVWTDTVGTGIEKFYAKTQADEEFVALADSADIGLDVWMLADTIIIGAFSAVDTFNTSFIYGSFYNGGSDTLVITEMRSVLQGTTPSVAVDIEWHATFASGSATGLNTTPPTITSITTGDSDTSFDNSQIPPGVFVWIKTPTVTTEPTFMSVTLLGYRLNRSY